MLIRKPPFTIERRPAILFAMLVTLAIPAATCVTASAADNPPKMPAAMATPQPGAADPLANGSSTTENENTGLQAEEADPLEPFNSAMFTFNLKVDDYVLHPVASGYSKIIPQGGREAIGRALDNVRVIPRVVNNAVQLRLPQAGTEVARFGINTTVGLVGLFDPADHWFGLKEHPDDLGLTFRYYGLPTGPYLMLPFFGPSTIGDTVGLIGDGFMDPISYFVPWYVSLSVAVGQRAIEAVNYRSLHLDQFEQADRYAVDLYGAVQDAYLQTRDNRVKDLKSGAD